MPPQLDGLVVTIIYYSGMADSNVEGDLKVTLLNFGSYFHTYQVEHVNAQFKAGLIHLCGNYNETAIQRVAKSLDLSSQLQEKLYPQFVDRC